jgi:sec-independent protein translocase protein TatA
LQDDADVPVVPIVASEINLERLMFGIGTTELLIILTVVFLFFGAKRLPGLGAGLGSAISGFRSAMRGDDTTSPASRDGSRQG